MKSKHILLLGALVMSLAFASCNKNEPFSTITPDDQPCIIEPIFPDRTASGELAIYQSFYRDANLEIELVVTPSEYSTVTWLLDGEPVHTGTTIDMPLDAGTYVLRVEVVTVKGKSTSRECLIEVKPLEGDPWSVAVGLDRYVAPGEKASFSGDNLDKVRSIMVGDVSVSDFAFDAESSTIAYTVPEEIQAGEYRLALFDAEGNRYGANKVTVLDEPAVLQGASAAAPGGKVVLQGLKLDSVASITIGDVVVETFESQSPSELVFVCPETLVSGETYSIRGTSESGNAILFADSGGSFVTEAQILMTSEVTVWEGHFAVLNWGEANFEGARYLLNDARVGSLLRIYYSIDRSAEYTQIRVVTGGWTRLLGETDADDLKPTEDGLIEMEMTQERIDLIRNNYGFMCVGHGYFVDKITLE